MNDVMHDLLNKLRVISEVREGQKLDTSNGLYVYTDSWSEWIKRKWYRDNKDEGVRFLRDLYKALQQSVETVINEIRTAPNDTKKALALYVLINTASGIKESVKGLENMSKTYAAFPTTRAAIKGILCDYVVVTYSSILEVIPIDKLTKELKESIVFNGQVMYKGISGMYTPPMGPIKTEIDDPLL